MHKIFFLSLLLLVFNVHSEIPMQWQSQIPTSYDYNDLQLLGNDTIVAVGYTGSFIRSYDGGLTWKFVWTKTLQSLTGVDFPDHQTGYAVGDANQYYLTKGILIKTTDGGDSWDTLVSPTNETLSDVDFINTSTGWISSDSCKIYKTTDGGLSWINQSFSGIDMIRRIFMLDADTGFVCGDQGLLYRTYDGGTTWTDAAPITNDKINSVYFINSQKGWCTAGNERIYRTSNGGTTWSIQLNGGGTSPMYSICFSDSLNGHAVSTAFIYRTTNGGLNWQSSNNTYREDHVIQFSDQQHGIMVGALGHIRKTIDGGVSWNDIAGQPSTFYDYKDIQFTDRNTGFCVGGHGSYRKTIDGGATWTFPGISTNADLYALYFLNNNYGFIVGGLGFIYKTTDGGATFTTLSTGGNETLLGVYFINQNVGWVCGGSSAVYKTTNGGTTWTQETLPSFTYSCNDIVFTDAQTGYIASWPNRIYKTTDGGTTWVQMPYVNGPGTYRKIQFLNPDTGWVAAENGYLIKTIDGGVNWTIQNQFCFGPEVGLHFIDPLNGYIGGGNANYNCKLYRTRDGGSTWENTDLPFGYTINNLWMTDTNRVYVCGEYGSILMCGDSTNLQTSQVEISDLQNLLTCYPNPSSKQLSIDLPESVRKENILIYNDKGELIKNFKADRTTIDISQLKSGLYFLKVGNYSGRFVKE